MAATGRERCAARRAGVPCAGRWAGGGDPPGSWASSGQRRAATGDPARGESALAEDLAVSMILPEGQSTRRLFQGLGLDLCRSVGGAQAGCPSHTMNVT